VVQRAGGDADHTSRTSCFYRFAQPPVNGA
jgi:hypothetical protein